MRYIRIRVQESTMGCAAVAATFGKVSFATVQQRLHAQ
jgi:hypothetical protein